MTVHHGGRLETYQATANLVIMREDGQHLLTRAWYSGQIQQQIPRIGESVLHFGVEYVVTGVLYGEDHGPYVRLTVRAKVP